jgi:uncharacterized membrane protein YciS (DUF1049 family)
MKFWFGFILGFFICALFFKFFFKMKYMKLKRKVDYENSKAKKWNYIINNCDRPN